MSKRKIAAKSNMEILGETIADIQNKIFDIETYLISNKTAFNSNVITVSSIIRVLLKKNIITENEISDIMMEVVEEIKEKRKLTDADKENQKKEIYDTILNSDVSANA